MIRFVAYGDPQPAGSKRAFTLTRRDGSVVRRSNGTVVTNVIDANPKAKDWKTLVALSAGGMRKELLDGPLAVQFYFFRPRPQGHFNSKGGLNKLGLATPYPATKPDVLKLARAVEDALTGVLWRDDAQIVSESILKRWGEPARVEVHVQEETLGG